jgi:hypothetical protein
MRVSFDASDPIFALRIVYFVSKFVYRGVKSVSALALLQHLAPDSHAQVRWSLVIRPAEDQDKNQAGDPAYKPAEDGAQWTN